MCICLQNTLQRIAVSAKFKIVLVGVGFLISLIANAQSDCRSIIGAHIKPIGGSPFSWGIEGLTAAGLMPDRFVANWNIYGALGFGNQNHQFYFEGAYKNYYNSASNPEGEEPQTDLPTYNRPEPKQFGLRELHYQYTKSNLKFKMGVQGLRTADYFLFDERMLGVSISKKWSSLEVSANIGTVSERIARFSDVCGTRHIYNIIHRSQYNFVGDRPFETNFGGVFFNWKPSARKLEVASSGDDDTFETFESGTEDEFSTDEFGSADEFSSDDFSTSGFDESKKSIPIKLEEMGLLFYEEFGTGFHEYKYFSGGFAQIQLPGDFEFKTELIDQYILNDHAVAYWLAVSKTKTWGNGSSSNLRISYLDKIDIDEQAHFYPAFSNLFLGEVLKLDAIDLPLLAGTVKYYFNHHLKSTLQVNGVMQLGHDHSREVDLIAGIKLFKHFRLTGIMGYMSSDLLDQNYWLARMELRMAF